MKNNNVLYIVLGVLITIVIVAVILLFPKLRTTDWSERYKRDDNKQPYDVDLIFNLLEGSNKERLETLEEDPLEYIDALIDAPEASSYIFFDNKAKDLDSLQVERLLNYAEVGNDVFFISEYPPEQLIQKYFEYIPNVKYWRSNHLYKKRDSTVTTSFVDDPQEKKYTFERAYKYGNTFKNWYYIDSSFICDVGYPVEKLAYLNEDEVNFFKINIGEGNVYVHSNPLFFSNYSLLQEDAFEYSNRVFSELNMEKIYWSEWNRPYIYSSGGNNSGLISRSPLRIFLEETSFKWAWYFLLFLLILFLIFRAKRDRPPVPVIEKNRNTSIEYVEAIVSLYFNKSEHHLVLRQLMQQWHVFIRKRYGVNRKIYAEEADFVKVLVGHSGLKEEELNPILEYYRAHFDEKTEVTYQELTRFYRLTESFYKKSK